MLDLYCERAGPGAWAEPLNAVTNLAFVAAAALAWREFRRQPDLDARNAWDLLMLIALLAAIGTGSALWHTLATVWAAAADVIPIVLFINLYLVSYLWRVEAAPALVVAGVWGVWQLMSVGLALVVHPTLMNGSAAYLPPLLLLAGLWLRLALRGHPLASTFAAACGLFVVSLAFRTLDGPACPAFPIGTHFLWHLLNGLLLYLLLADLIRHGRRRTGGAATIRSAG